MRVARLGLSAWSRGCCQQHQLRRWSRRRPGCRRSHLQLRRISHLAANMAGALGRGCGRRCCVRQRQEPVADRYRQRRGKAGKNGAFNIHYESVP